MYRANARRGMTLVELIIAAVLALMILGMVWQFLVPSMRFTAEGAAKVELQQQSILALNRMIADLQQAPATAISVSSGGTPALAVNRIAQVHSSGIAHFENTVQVYWFDAANSRLWFEEFTVADPADHIAERPTKMTSLQIDEIVNQTSGSERSVASNVQSFSASFDPNNGGVLILDMQMDKKVPHTEKRAQVEMTRRVHLRNS